MRIQTSIKLAVAVFICALLPVGSALAEDTGGARQVVQTIISKARTLDFKATHAENARVIESLVDFRKLADDALGDRSNDVNAAQKKEIQELLRKVITKSVYPEASKFFRDVSIDYTGEETSASGRVHITSVVTKQSKRSTVEYWLLHEEGGFRVVDLAIEGESWVANVHDQFDEILGKYGATGLISRLKKRLTQLESKKG